MPRASTSAKDQSREIVYGMPYAEWQALNQTEASDAKKAEFEARRPRTTTGTTFTVLLGRVPT